MHTLATTDDAAGVIDAVLDLRRISITVGDGVAGSYRFAVVVTLMLRVGSEAR